jgi:hypothetical protein
MPAGIPTPDSAGAAGDQAAGSGGATGAEAGAGAGASTGGEEPVEFPPRSVCGPEENEYSKRYCADLEMVSIHLAAIEDAGGDGEVSAGEEGYVVFSLRYDGPELFVNGPCVGLLPAIPGLTVLEASNPILKIYGVGAGTPINVKLRFRVEKDVAPGTRIPLLGWLDMHSALCPNGHELRFELVVAP